MCLIRTKRNTFNFHNTRPTDSKNAKSKENTLKNNVHSSVYEREKRVILTPQVIGQKFKEQERNQKLKRNAITREKAITCKSFLWNEVKSRNLSNLVFIHSWVE